MHQIEPNEKTLHGYFSTAYDPVLEIESGESVRFKTLAANWTEVGASGQLETVVQGMMAHALCGPVAIKGAKPGMVLEIQIDKIVPASRGYNRGGGLTNWMPFRRFGVADGEICNYDWDIDVEAGTAKGVAGRTVKLAPFMGVMGLPPNIPGEHITHPPRHCGGNIDCKELVEGTTLYLPITVDGALFSTGDGHAAQGDGEVSGTAIECPMEQVDLTFILRDDMAIGTPHAKIREGWMTLGFDEDLDEAAFIACNAMLDFIMREYKVNRKEALALASVVVDLRVTQIVNGVKGVHAVLPDGAIT